MSNDVTRMRLKLRRTFYSRYSGVKISQAVFMSAPLQSHLAKIAGDATGPAPLSFCLSVQTWMSVRLLWMKLLVTTALALTLTALMFALAILGSRVKDVTPASTYSYFQWLVLSESLLIH